MSTLHIKLKTDDYNCQYTGDTLRNFEYKTFVLYAS